MRGTVVRGIWFVAALAFVGCSTIQPRTLRIDSAAGMYQGVTLTYRVDGGQLSEPLTVARIVDGQVKQERLASSPYPDRSVVRLSIRYPHPDGKAGFALAEMVVETRTPPKSQVKKAVWQEWTDTFATAARDMLPGIKMSDDVYEAWALDIAKSDLDRVIAGMSQSGYFVNPSKQTLGVELAARIDNFQAVKHWSREPELDIMLERIRQEGQLVSYVHPPQSVGPATAVPAGPYVNGTMLVAQHEEIGPALMPAGPQNNAYQYPPETATPRSAPIPPPAANPLAPAPGYTPIPPYTPPPATDRIPSGRSPYQRPAQGMAQPPAGYPPAATQPSITPRNRGQYPPQYGRAGAAPTGPARNAPATQAAPPGRSRAAPQQRSPRMPWQRPATAPAIGQQAGVSQAPAPTTGQDPRRPRMQRYPATPTQRPANGRMPARSQRPAGNPPPAIPYSANAQSGAPPAVGSPSGLPQPPQLNPVPARY